MLTSKFCCRRQSFEAVSACVKTAWLTDLVCAAIFTTGMFRKAQRKRTRRHEGSRRHEGACRHDRVCRHESTCWREGTCAHEHTCRREGTCRHEHRRERRREPRHERRCERRRRLWESWALRHVMTWLQQFICFTFAWIIVVKVLSGLSWSLSTTNAHSSSTRI